MATGTWDWKTALYTIVQQEAQLASLRRQLDAARKLIAEQMEYHKFDNNCDADPCKWCEEAGALKEIDNG